MVIFIMLVMVNVAINDADADLDNGSNYKFAIMHNILLLRHDIFWC